MTRDDEFYIGYEGGMPPGMAAAVKMTVLVAAAAGALIASAFVAGERPLAASRFEFGRARSVDGYLQRLPAPALLVREGAGWRRMWLVSTGKFGPARALADQPEGWIRLTGSLIQRERWSMLEVQPGSVRRIPGAGPAPEPVSVDAGRTVVLTGEVVDSKCFLGVMNPGERTVHRDCASRCLSGGIPAMLSFRAADGSAQLALILTADGLPAGPRLLDRTGHPVRLKGTLAGGSDAMTFTLFSGD